MDKRIIKAYWGDDCIINSLGFSTQENVAGIEKYNTRLSSWHNGTPVCLIDSNRLESEITKKNISGFTKAAQIAILALSNINTDLSNERTVLILSTTKGDIGYINTCIEKCYLASLAESIGNYFNAKNNSIIISNACISGVSAIITGSRLISQGEYDNIYVVGLDLLNDFIISGFNSFKSISKQICLPYDIERNGLTLGEGCAAVHLTNNPCLSKNKIIVAGGGISNDANHISGPSRTGDGLYLAIKAAMLQAGLSSKEIGFINTHGTATLFNDEMESKALNLSNLLDTPCNSLKPYFGHTLGASGVIESILAAHQLQTGTVYGVKGYKTCGVPCQLNISAEHRKIKINSCIKTASGFGGCNAALVLCKDENYPANITFNSVSQNIQINKTAHIEITKNNTIPFGEYIRQEYKQLQESNIKFTKMDDLCKLGYIAASKLLKTRELHYSSERISIILANKSSSLESDIKHQNIINQHNPEGTSPAVFVYTLPNIVAGEIAIKHNIKGETTFFVFPNKNLKFAEAYARNLIKNNHSDAVIYGWCELFGEDYNAELTILEKQ